MRYRAGVLRCAPFASVLRFAPVASLLRLPTLGYTFVSPLGSVRFRAGVRSRSCRPTGCLRQATQPAPAGMCSLPVDFATLHPLGYLRQSFSLRSIILPYRAPCGSLIRRFQLLTLPGLHLCLSLGISALSRWCSLPVDFATLHPSGCLRQSFSLRSIILPYGLPAAGSVGSHPPPGCLTLRAAYAAYRATALLLGSQPAPAGMCSGLPPSLPLMSPYGLPSAGYPASPRWHVFRFQVSGFRFQVSGFRFLLPPPYFDSLRALTLSSVALTKSPQMAKCHHD